MRLHRALVTAAALALAAGTPARAGAPPRPQKIHGTLSYRERGPLAQPGGILSALLAPAQGAVAIGRLRGVLGAVAQLADKGGQAGTKDINDVLVRGFPVDLRLPIRAGYTADLEFELQPSAKDRDRYELASGTIRWSGDANGEIDTGGERRHVLKDSMHDGGSSAIDPKTSRVDLTFDGKAGTYTLSVSVQHPMRPSGTSTWKASYQGHELMDFRIDASQGRERWVMKFLGQSSPPEERGGDEHRTVVYEVTRRLDGGMSGTETFRDLLDNQVVAEHSLAGRCQARIVQPAEDGKWIFDKDRPGVLEEELRAEVTPKGFEKYLVWEVPEIPDSERKVEPEDRKGASVKVRYEGMPKRGTFGRELKVSARFEGNPGTCEDPEAAQVKLYFARDGKNNESASAVGQDRPNYFFLWFPAVSPRLPAPAVAAPRAASMKQDASTDPFRSERVTYYSGSRCAGLMGYYSKGSSEVHLCELADYGFAFTNPLTGKSFEGIDAFGAEMLHEWTHYEHYWAWSGQRDSDHDGVPDEVEAANGTDPNDPNCGIIPGVGRIAGDVPKYFDDEEILTFLATDTWPVRAADEEDWACPGKQCTEEP